MGIRGHLDRAALLLQLAQHALDLRIEQDPLRRPLVLDGLFAVGISAPARMREQVEAGVLDDDSALQQLGQRAADLVHALAVEDQLGEAAVDLERLLQAPVLGVDDALEKWGHDVDELDVGGDGEQRHAEPLRLGQHLGRELFQVRKGLDDKTDASRIRDPADQTDLGRAVVLDREPGRQQQVARARLDVRCLHEPHPLDLAVETVLSRHQLGACERPVTHRVADGGPRLAQDLGGLLGHVNPQITDVSRRQWSAVRRCTTVTMTLTTRCVISRHEPR